MARKRLAASVFRGFLGSITRGRGHGRDVGSHHQPPLHQGRLRARELVADLDRAVVELLDVDRTADHTALLARAHDIAGQTEEALSALDDALQIVGRTGERWLETEFYRHKGGILRRQGHTAAAEELYRKALSISDEQEAKLWQLRAATSLARLMGEQGRRTEARELLASVYGWFTEGFNTPDLKEATRLLDELA